MEEAKIRMSFSLPAGRQFSDEQSNGLVDRRESLGWVHWSISVVSLGDDQCLTTEWSTGLSFTTLGPTKYRQLSSLSLRDLIEDSCVGTPCEEWSCSVGPVLLCTSRMRPVVEIGFLVEPGLGR